MEITEGIFAVYKPKGVYSYKIVSCIKKLVGKKIKVGHGGTLDPIAEGVIVIAVGRKYTKQLHSILTNSEKEYIAEILLDRTSDTYDITGKIQMLNITTIPSITEINNVLQTFIGEIDQTPPPYSAIKIHGKRACDILRSGKVDYNTIQTIIKPKKVIINHIEILNYEFPLLKLKIVCKSGTYIRSLANDLGKSLCCGGVIKSLIRTRVGNFTLSDCKRIENLLQY